MPSWWSKKSSKHKDSPTNSPKSPTPSKTRVNATNNNDNKPNKSFDELFISRKDYGGVSTEFSGFDSSSSLDRVYPLPRPSTSSAIDQGSVSGSSVGSSVSSDDNNNTHVDHTQLATFRGHGDGKSSPLPKSPRAGTPVTSPRHPRVSGVNIDSLTGRCEDVRGEFHRLPLPPGSPTSSSAFLTSRNSGGSDTCHNLSKWKKGRLLGRGTFGHVYLGFNSDKGKMCAIKEVRLSDDKTSKECLKQLNQEINLLSQLCQPNIVQYYGSEMGEETLSVYLEYVSGGSIHKLLQEYGPFSEPVIQNYTRQILSGLAYLHGRNTVHRDIKGANILVDPNGEIKLADFGMAKHITACTSALSFKGSPYWMAPEVVMNTNGYNLQVDIWSLGCTVLEMATSKPPWSQFEGVAAIFKIGNSREIPDIPSHLSANAKSFIRTCLQREPTARPSASQLFEHPFIKEQSTRRNSNSNITREEYSIPSDGRRTPPALDTQSSRMQYGSSDGNVKVSRASINPRENPRTLASLPVSPCSSPLRQHGSSQMNFLSPTHPSYASMGQRAYKMNGHALFPVTTNSRSTLDSWPQIPQLKAPAPASSQRARLIL
ncbi:non-receptor serine/threonine protein kinase [Lithospermum erythrorhizon]|uniref:mitogen-activated protein kinase kinase kinase n=1 Tax=Lithospermum erythrorhizon TaxID=34254 RepID=A0AAV3RV41_LITER